jgi:2-polyprenyl-6-methoxyphenol hydroxylase-like FAD-dependent oxidoreductase
VSRHAEAHTRREEGDLRVLIVGAGIAGPTLAYWLQRANVEVTLAEHALSLPAFPVP